jgi:hypothetical protein
MTILNKLASSLGRRDEVPNKQLAEEIAAADNKVAVKELIEQLHGKKKDIQSDCIKVLYEIGERKPALIAPYIKEFIGLLQHKNNRLQWGAMAALDAIATEKPKEMYNSLPQIIAAAELGSVITKDHCVNILVRLGRVRAYNDDVSVLLMEQLANSLPNQLPTYAEKAMEVINEKNKTVFIQTLRSRLGEYEGGAKKSRMEKLIKKLEGVK